MDATHVWEPAAPGEGSCVNRPARIVKRSIPVRVPGTRNRFEPTRVLAQTPDGEWHNVDPCELHELPAPTTRGLDRLAFTIGGMS